MCSMRWPGLVSDIGEEGIGHLGKLFGRALAALAAAQGQGDAPRPPVMLGMIERRVKRLVGGCARELGDLGDEGFDAEY